jgi:two-component system LytT family sensor kinase
MPAQTKPAAFWKRPAVIIAAIWIAPAVLATIGHMAQQKLYGEPQPSLRELLWSGGDWLVYAIITPAILWISRRWPIARPHIARRVCFHVAVSLLFCVAWATLGKLLELVLGLAFDFNGVRAAVSSATAAFWWKLGRDWLSWVFTTLPFGAIVYLTVVGIAHAIQYFSESAEREVQLARLSEQLAGARFSALQAQLNPHFLFNTLNTIAVRARDGDGAGTARIVEQLSNILRRTLSRHRANEVALADEMELVRQYLAIEQARFSDRLRPEFDIDEGALRAAVPGFSLQHLVENAIRHGIAKRSDAGRVLVRAKRQGDMLELTVIDDGIGITQAVSGSSAPPSPSTSLRPGGIENTRERLRALYGDRASLVVRPGDDQGTAATLRLPYRELPLDEQHGQE